MERYFPFIGRVRSPNFASRARDARHAIVFAPSRGRLGEGQLSGRGRDARGEAILAPRPRGGTLKAGPRGGHGHGLQERSWEPAPSSPSRFKTPNKPHRGHPRGPRAAPWSPQEAPMAPTLRREGPATFIMTCTLLPSCPHWPPAFDCESSLAASSAGVGSSPLPYAVGALLLLLLLFLLLQSPEEGSARELLLFSPCGGLSSASSTVQHLSQTPSVHTFTSYPGHMQHV